jgi:tellurite resistance protein TerC
MTLWWIIFGISIFAMLALDLGIFNRKAHVIKMKE